MRPRRPTCSHITVLRHTRMITKRYLRRSDLSLPPSANCTQREELAKLGSYSKKTLIFYHPGCRNRRRSLRMRKAHLNETTRRTKEEFGLRIKHFGRNGVAKLQWNIRSWSDARRTIAGGGGTNATNYLHQIGKV